MVSGRYYRPAAIWAESVATFILAGPAAEELFCGSVDDGIVRVHDD
jgi:hypothetical protein